MNIFNYIFQLYWGINNITLKSNKITRYSGNELHDYDWNLFKEVECENNRHVLFCIFQVTVTWHPRLRQDEEFVYFIPVLVYR